VWIYPTSWDAVESTNNPGFIVSQYHYGSTGSEYYGYGLGIEDDVYTTKGIRFNAGFTVTRGLWKVDNCIPTLNTWYYVEVQWDGTTNAPRIVVNGVEQTVTPILSPAGVFQNSGTSYPLLLGSLYENTHSYWMTFQGRYENVIIWNYQRSVADAQDAYNSRSAQMASYGAVFHPVLIGASGLQDYDGVALAAGNQITDSITGARGTPHGSPVGLGDTILTWR
jgi:hypothetical protein